MVPGFYPYCAMMQVAAEDTHANYVLCRGFDIRIAKFIDYDAADLVNSPGIPVAKPYSNRRVGAYEIAQIFPALLPLQTGNPSPADVLWRVGQNPGVAATTAGHPADLSEEVEILYTDDDPAIAINWMMIDSSGTSTALVELCAQETASRNTPYTALLGTWNEASNLWCYDDATTVYAIDHRYGMQLAEEGWKGLYQPMASDTYGTIYVCVSLDCALPPEGCNLCEES